MEREIPSEAEVQSYLTERRNWGRWGDDDQKGAVNLITAEKRLAAAKLVRSGRTVSLSRPFPTTPAGNNPNPAQHFMRRSVRPGGGGATDYYGISYHGFSTTHLDALCHVWNENGMWNGRKADDVIAFDGARWASVDNWKEGIITRGVLLDVPAHRGQPYVTPDQPVHGWELEEIAAAQGVSLQPGDALVVYSGRDAWDKENPIWGSDMARRPGLHASCLTFIRDVDCSLLVWDMMDAAPSGYSVPWTVHGVIFAYGVGLLDNAYLQAAAEACREEGRYEFMLTVAPLLVIGGTGSPANPIALF